MGFQIIHPYSAFLTRTVVLVKFLHCLKPKYTRAPAFLILCSDDGIMKPSLYSSGSPPFTKSTNKPSIQNRRSILIGAMTGATIGEGNYSCDSTEAKSMKDMFWSTQGDRCSIGEVERWAIPVFA